MDGPGVFKMARRRIRDVVRKLLTDHGFTTQDVDWVVPHQASGHGMQLVARLGFPPERIANVVGRYGNCVAAGVPMALTHIASTGQLQRGDLVLLLGTGAGLSVGTALLRW
jgi:3-oxoacyl-[acyl-carrier-protein] synthase-3